MKKMTANVVGSDTDAESIVVKEVSPESTGRSIYQDLKYITYLSAFYLKTDPLLGGILWLSVLGFSGVSGYLGLQLVLRMAAVTNGLVAHDQSAVETALSGWFFIICLYLAYQIVSISVTYALRIRLRTVLVNRILGKWFSNGRLYDPSHASYVDHPEQRVQEDTYNFALWTLDIVPALLGALVSFFLYSQQLWHIARPLTIPLPFESTIIIPRALYVFAIVSAVVVTLLSHLVGRALTQLEVVRQRLEAGFRHNLGMVRQFSEQIVLSGGERIEAERANHNYSLIQKNWRPYTIFTALLTGIEASTSQIGQFIPWFLLTPFVFSGTMNVGDLMIAAPAYLSVYMVFAIGSRVYLSFAQLRSSAQRLYFMDYSFSHHPKLNINKVRNNKNSFALEQLEIRSSSGDTLVRVDDLSIIHGQKWLIKGKSGSGKSTLFRCLAGIWPFAGGTIRYPSGEGNVMFLPQKPYLPNGSLCELLSYPNLPNRFSREEYQKVLHQVCLDHMVAQLDVVDVWSQILSPGEQQRICLGRAILQQPDFLFLDEATSALDPETEAAVFKAIIEYLPDTTLVTIAHSDRLEHYHDHLMSIEGGHAGITELAS